MTSLWTEEGKVAKEDACWADVERVIDGHFAGNDWLYLELRFGDVTQNVFMIVSSRTCNSHLFAVFATFDGKSFFCPVEKPPGGLFGTYLFNAPGVYPENACVSHSVMLHNAKTFFDQRRLDDGFEWIACQPVRSA